jgi:hypothetical protein
MKNFIKWSGGIGLLILIIVCADMNLNGAKLSVGNVNLREVINIITAAIVMIIVIGIFISKKSTKRGE